MAVGDVTGDGLKEIVAVSLSGSYGWDAQVVVYNRRGEMLPGFPVLMASTSVQSIALVDVDLDGRRDIVLTAMWQTGDVNSGKVVVRAYDSHGGLVREWVTSGKTKRGAAILSTAIGDVDGDCLQDMWLVTLNEGPGSSSDFPAGHLLSGAGGYALGRPIETGYFQNPAGRSSSQIWTAMARRS